MKVWYDKDKLNLEEFKSEKFLFLPLYDDEILKKDNDFKDNLEWKKEINNFITYTEKEDADVILFHDKLNNEIVDYINESKPVIAFYNDDNDKPINEKIHKNIFVYRTSMNKSIQKNNEYTLPAWSSDFGQAPIRHKSKWIPGFPEKVVSFCGALTHPDRKKCVDQLSKNTNIRTNFIIRNAFWGGNPHDKTIRQEYIENLKSCDFVLCCRGAGNFSYRLYETLSVGRIPIIIDTDNTLPCDDVIDWNKFIITTPDNINADIEEWWGSIDDNEYKSRQEYSREVYDNFIKPSGFAKYLGGKKW